MRRFESLTAKALRGACCCGLWCGCAVTSADRNVGILQTALTEAGLPAAVESFFAEEGLLTHKLLRFRYVRQEPPAMFWLLCFAEDPSEQYPHEVRSLQAVLEDVRAGTESFQQGTEFKWVSKTQTVIEGVHYSFREAGEGRRGVICLWTDQDDAGATIYLLRVVAPDEIPIQELQAILKGVGAL